MIRMAVCKQCGKEIPEGKKFCNRSCAAKYNNKHRTRKPWTEEQRKAIQHRDRQRCKYCGKDTGRYVNLSAILGVCAECKPFVGKLQTYKKLGLHKGSLKARELKLHRLIKRFYLKGMTISDMYSRYRLHNVTVRRILSEESVHLRSLSEEQRRTVEKKGTIFKGCVGSHISWEGKIFFFRSKWEEQFMQNLDKHRVSYEYEPFTVRYWDSELALERVAIPDFYLPETNEIIELKSCWTFQGQEQRMKDKFKAYEKQGYMPKLLLDWKYVELK